ncbi:DNA polymerase III subunit epsilon [Agrobacterium vitis]|uniref:DNA polymerase III subunit epsilon n=1 Tax=Agrobacterium vitis TaxID=373 RepID=UPI0012E89105|nr:DNA polymerase III subunit epsilon [Agrobacterium vitis]MVA24338.1 DNA polymerase III subunit epsilon [Agrobacterium vitis]MVA53363.1 DNA polymerase III subunit epsilon [Agrobacterium vitis]MVA72325.1 DNA polymerase III subunit epsilon [Agrobacterium vitis]NSZ51285.1 DNA polymerase III subunit epsilon [Agrobacterium vitis]NTA33286.1 DNA polymerase III subunit epsilon [Agrobacterium vitis]
MREIVFDTETTGLESKLDRVIEIGGIELFNHFPTGRSFHVYINPADRAIHPDALAVHGITPEFLKDKPVFADIVEDLVAFFDGAKWVAHNATFDMGFINAEFERLGRPPVGPEHVVDTLSLARRKHPMGPNSLDALCRRYGIDNSHRTKHGALLDSELLAEVYIEMLGGRQATFGLEQSGNSDKRSRTQDSNVTVEIAARPKTLAPRLTEAEQERHAALVKRLGQKAIWAHYNQGE